MSLDAMRLLTVADLQKLLQVRGGTLYRALRAGRLPPPIRIACATGHPRWRADVIEAWLEAQTPSVKARVGDRKP